MKIHKWLWSLTIAFSALSANDYNLDSSEFLKLQDEANILASQEEYMPAAEIYLKLFNSCSASSNTELYVGLGLRLAGLYFRAENYEKAEKLLFNLRQQEDVQDFLLPIEIMHAQTYYRRGLIAKAYLILKKLAAEVPLEEWAVTDKQLFLNLEYTLNEYYEDLLVQAESFFEASLLKETIPIYREVLYGIHQGYYPKANDPSFKSLLRGEICYLLGEAYFFNKDYQQCLKILKSQGNSPQQPYYLDTLYLIGKTYNKLHQYERAIEVLSTYLTYDNQENPETSVEAHWEIGMAYFNLKQYQAARPHLAIMPSSQEPMDDYFLPRLCLAKIYLYEGNLNLANRILQTIKQELTSDDPLSVEATYLLGESAFFNQDYLQAIDYYTDAFLIKGFSPTDGKLSGLSHLGWSYFKASNESSQELHTNLLFLDKAQEAFEELLTYYDDEKALLGLAQIHLARSQLIGTPLPHQKIRNLLENHSFQSIDDKAEALLLRAKAACSHQEKLYILRSLSSETYSTTPVYAISWHYLGEAEYTEGIEAKNHNEINHAEEKFTLAEEAFQKAFSYSQDNNRLQAVQSLKALAQLYSQRTIPLAKKLAADTLIDLINNKPLLFEAATDQDEILYLSALFASQNTNLTLNYYKNAIQALERLKKNHPSSSYLAQGLNLLGNLYLQQDNHQEAEKAFLTLAKDYPSHDDAAEAWFQAGKCAERLERPSKIVKSYLTKVFQHYPHHSRAPQAYFEIYNWSDYLQGDTLAIKHLKAMEDKFYSTPYLGVSYYLLGLNLKNTCDADAAIFFDKAFQVFDECYSSNLISEQDLEYFTTLYYRTLLEKGLALINLSYKSNPVNECQKATATEPLKKINADFQQHKPPLNRLSKISTPLIRIHKECLANLDKYNIEQ
ncbi:MAG: tetratricopeptide repeat protein [Chlamydiota bacterium]